MTMTTPQDWRALSNKAWRVLRHPAALPACVALALLLIAAAAWLTQLPGQLRDEPVSAARWSTESAAPYGWLGTAARALGLFDVFHSPLLYATLATLALLLSAMLADELATLRQFAHLRQLALPDIALPHTPLNVQPGPVVHHERVLLASDVAAVQARLAAIPDLGNAQATTFLRTATPEPDHSTASGAPSPSPTHFITVDHPRLAWLRPLLPAGLLLALAAVWIAIGSGHSVTSPLLAPGDHFRIGQPALLALYRPPASLVAPPANAIDAGPLQLLVSGAMTTEIPLTGPISLAVDGVRLSARPEALALWVAVTGAGSPQVVLPGDETPRSNLGIVVAAQADETTLLLPQAAAGLRILPASPAGSAIVVELYRSDRADPLWRTEVRPDAPRIMQVDPTTDLYLGAVPALRITVQDISGRAGAWLGIVVALMGAAGYRRTPAFVVAHIQPWATHKSLVLVQSNSAARLRAFIHALQAA